MEVKFPVEESILMTALKESHGIQVDSLQFIPMGDSAYSYRVDGTDGQRYYMKLFDHSNDKQRRSIERLQHYLPLTWDLYHRELFTDLTYPIRTKNGGFAATFNGITTVLFTFIEGEALADAYPFSRELLEAVAGSMAAVHRVTPYIDHAEVGTETFDISFESDLRMCFSKLESASILESRLLRSLRESVLPVKARIFRLLELVREHRSAVAADPADMVLCHGDMWGGNMIRRNGEIFLIDWEAAIVAPPEFDLFGYIGEGFEVFYSAYLKQASRTVALRPDLLRFYAYRHHLRNLTNWLMNILYRDLADVQKENDLDMITNHCLNRLDPIEPNLQAVQESLRRRFTP